MANNWDNASPERADPHGEAFQLPKLQPAHGWATNIPPNLTVPGDTQGGEGPGGCLANPSPARTNNLKAREEAERPEPQTTFQ